MTSEITFEGRCWLFPEANINTDLMMPSRGYSMSLADRAKLVFATVRPGWADLVHAGDVLVAGKNFGTGSSRPAAQLFRQLGIQALVAESINDIFFRNCVNYGLPALACPGIVAASKEADTIRGNLREGTIVNCRTGQELKGRTMPDFLIELIAAGGLHEKLRRDGYL